MVFNHENPLGFDTKDIWIEHPTLKGWYRYGGRAGDVTVLSNGEKTDNKQLRKPTILLLLIEIRDRHHNHRKYSYH
jgi:hypothetical protein